MSRPASDYYFPIFNALKHLDARSLRHQHSLSLGSAGPAMATNTGYVEMAGRPFPMPYGTPLVRHTWWCRSLTLRPLPR